MSDETQRLTFGPFMGHVSSVARHQAPPTALTGDSRDLLYDPFEQAFYSRSGSTIQRDTYSNGEVTGLLRAKWGATDRQMVAFDSPSLSDGYPTQATLYTTETNTGFSSTVDTGWFGTLYVANTNQSGASGNYQLLAEFGSNHYPTNASSASGSDIVVVPLWYESGDGGYTRGSTEFASRFLCSGAQNVMQLNDSLYAGNLRGTPWQWFEKRFNDNTGTGTSQKVRIRPAGPLPLVGEVSVTVPSTNADGNWVDGDTFFLSVVPLYKDGSRGAPMLPRAINGTLTNGFQLITVGSVGSSSHYRTITYTNIPKGGADVVAREIWRSTKTNRSASTTPLTGSPGDMRYVGTIFNNTQTSFVDSAALDAALVVDTTKTQYRNDLKMMPRARHIGTGDERLLAAYTLPSQCALLIAPWVTPSGSSLNLMDDEGIYGSQSYVVRITSTALELCTLASGTLTTTSITLNSSTSIQDVCDQINATTNGTTPDKASWRAQVLPGADGTAASTLLCPTTVDVTGCVTANGSATMTVGDSSKIPVGANVYDSNSKIAAGVYVKSKESATSITLSAAASGVCAGTCVFYSDCGDGTSYDAAKRGYIRAFSPAYPFVAYFKRSALPGYDRPDKQSVHFTVASPGAAAVGSSLAPNMWQVFNKKFAPSYLGPCMGIRDIEGAAVVGYARGIRMFMNIRGVNTGEDFDYRLFTVNEHRGVVDGKGMVAGNGWCAYPTYEGFVAIDKNRVEKKFSGAIYNHSNPDPTTLGSSPTIGLGDIAYEIETSRTAAEGDKDNNRMYAAILGTQLHIGYRSSSSFSYPNRRQVYDFGKGIDAGGLEQLLDPETRSEAGWSTPQLQTFSCMCEVTTSGGRKRFGAVQSNLGVTGDGRYEVFDDIASAGSDNGTGIFAKGYMATIIAPAFAKWSAYRAEVTHYASTSGAVLYVYPDKVRSPGYTTNLSTSSGAWTKEIINFVEAANTPADCIEMAWHPPISADGCKLWKISVEAEAASDY